MRTGNLRTSPGIAVALVRGLPLDNRADETPANVADDGCSDSDVGDSIVGVTGVVLTDTTEGEDKPFAIVVCIAEEDDEVDVVMVLTMGMWVPLVCVPFVNGCFETAVKGIRRETVSDEDLTEDCDVGADADDAGGDEEVAKDDTVAEDWVSACVVPTTVDFGSNSSAATSVTVCAKQEKCHTLLTGYQKVTSAIDMNGLMLKTIFFTKVIKRVA